MSCHIPALPFHPMYHFGNHSNPIKNRKNLKKSKNLDFICQMSPKMLSSSLLFIQILFAILGTSAYILE